jgi:ADP-ribose pyrophosphatase
MEESSDPDRGVQVLARQTPYDGYLRIDRYDLRHGKFGGGKTKPMRREVMDRGEVVGLLPYDPREDKVVLIEQFRIGAYAASQKPWLTEIVAGVIGKDETPESVARRETIEETGLEPGRIEGIGFYLMSPGCSTEAMHLFCGEVDSRHASGIHGLDHEGEDIRVFSLSFDDAAALLTSGALTNFPIVLALQWLVINHQRIKSSWNA